LLGAYSKSRTGDNRGNRDRRLLCFLCSRMQPRPSSPGDGRVTALKSITPGGTSPYAVMILFSSAQALTSYPLMPPKVHNRGVMVLSDVTELHLSSVSQAEPQPKRKLSGSMLSMLQIESPGTRCSLQPWVGENRDPVKMAVTGGGGHIPRFGGPPPVDIISCLAKVSCVLGGGLPTRWAQWRTPLAGGPLAVRNLGWSPAARPWDCPSKCRLSMVPRAGRLEGRRPFLTPLFYPSGPARVWSRIENIGTLIRGRLLADRQRDHY
jgi:hypothetical protein